LGDGNKFKNCRVGIELDKDTLTLVRMRPDRLMFKARRVGDGKWESVGWLNIDRKDVERLERLNEGYLQSQSEGVSTPESGNIDVG
jgi:hypothetical protein